jgi:3-hydroxyisobutyrate dehydrogenase
MATIGFIGLGNMGAPMAANLARAGHAVRGFDLAPRAQEAARQSGVAVANSANAAAEGADVVVTMLPAGPHVRDIYDDPAGPLSVAAPGTLFIECSTIDIETARAAHAAAAAAGMASLDAPVSGGVGGAVAGTLTFMVGGDAAAFARAQPVLQAMGRRIVHCGAATAGQAAKICNNMILGVSMIAVGEAFVLAEKLGLSHQAMFDVVSTSSGQCWSLTNYCPVPGPVPASPANNGYKPGFATTLMVKDLVLAQEAAKAAGAETALGRHAAELYTRFAQEGQAGMDFSGIINAIRAWSGGNPA